MFCTVVTVETAVVLAASTPARAMPVAREASTEAPVMPAAPEAQEAQETSTSPMVADSTSKSLNKTIFFITSMITRLYML